jgi:ABC-type Fe3+-hydroxamate transport system substrate-binding protein
MTDKCPNRDKERVGRLRPGMGFQVVERGGSMKARYVVVIGLAVLAAACSSPKPAATPSTSTSTTVSPTSTSTTVSPTSTSTTVSPTSTSTTVSPTSTSTTVSPTTPTTAVSSTKASQQFLAAATVAKAAYFTWRAAIKGLTTVSPAIGPCDTYAGELTTFDNAISRIDVTGKTETDIQTLVSDDRVVIKNLEAVRTETVAQLKKDRAQLIATGETAISASDVVRSDLGLPPS